MIKKHYILIISLPLIFLATFASAANLSDAFKVDDTHVCNPAVSDRLDCAANWAKYDVVATTGPEDIVNNAITIVLSVLGLVFMALFIYAGTLWMMAGGNEEKVSKAQAIMRQSLIGLAIVIAAYAISYFVLNYFVNSSGQLGVPADSGDAVLN